MKCINFSLVLFAIIFTMSSCSDDDILEVSDDDPIELTDKTAQLVKDWSDVWVSIDQFTSGLRPNSVTRSLAYIHLIGYETAVPFMSDYGSNDDRLGFEIDLNELGDDVNLNLALNEAYARALDHFMFIQPNSLSRKNVRDFRDENIDELSEGLSDIVIGDSRRWGRHVAQRIIEYSKTDLEGEEQVKDPTPDDYIAPVGDGLWVASEDEAAWFPYWREVRTFAITPEETTSTAFSSRLTYSTEVSSAYYATMNEVYETNNDAASGNDEELWIAEFWADDIEGLMISPPGRQFSIANQLILQFDLGYERTLELLLRLGFAINDAAVSAWDDKYTYNVQRPSEYIIPIIDVDFTTNLSKFTVESNPAFPAYPSGHATFAGVGAGIFIEYFGTDNIDFTDNTYLDFDYVVDFEGTPRSFTSFTDMAFENAYSRVPLGVHIIEDATEGLRLGYEIADAVNSIDLSE